MGQRFCQTVLIVDDEEYIRALAAAVLKDEGFEVLEASSIEEAIDLASRSSIDILLTDLNLPGETNGMQLADQIRSFQPSVHVVLSSGDDEPVASIKREGAIFLAKPYRPHQLTAAVRPRTIG